MPRKFNSGGFFFVCFTYLVLKTPFDLSQQAVSAAIRQSAFH